MYILDYGNWKVEIERYSVEEFGNIEKTKNWSVSQPKLDAHMSQYARRFAMEDPQRLKQVLKENREFMKRYTRELRG